MADCPASAEKTGVAITPCDFSVVIEWHELPLPVRVEGLPADASGDVLLGAARRAVRVMCARCLTVRDVPVPMVERVERPDLELPPGHGGWPSMAVRR